jgi:light-regulated signal transduction histidine kinase (bacteriophytochrome)
MLNHEKIQTTDAFWRNLSFIQSKLKISDFDISQRANLNWQKFIFSKNNSLSLPFHSVEKLSQFLSISTEQLILGSIGNRFESKVLEHQWANSLEDKYQLGTSSKSLTLRHLIKLAKRNNVYQQVISHFRLPEHLLEAKLDFDVSVQLLADIIDFIDSLVPLTENDFKFVAEQNAFYFQHSVFGNILKSAQNPIEIYES